MKKLPATITICMLMACMLGYTQSDSSGNTVKDFKELAHRYKEKRYREGGFKIEEVRYVHSDSVFHRQLQFQVFCYLINGGFYKSEIGLDLPNWNYLLPLTKNFTLPDSSLGLITFLNTGGPGHGPCGKASRLILNIWRINSLGSESIFELSEDECNQSVTLAGIPITDTINGKNSMATATLKNIDWHGSELWVKVTLYPGKANVKQVTYKVSFTNLNGKVMAQVSQ